ncbi:MAG: tetratricopeptide repeat protein [Luminiphilus sp.]|nr:tetratricopeptide repeat protein [Luminiphilus sp.]
MADHMQDEADLDAIKRWWDENGKSLVAAIIVAVLGTVGWQQYQGYQGSQEQAASDLYATMLAIQLEEGDSAQLAAAGATLKSEHSGSTYAHFAAMLEARIAVEAEDLERAEASLRWALSVGDPHSDIGQLIQLRLARVMAARGSEEEALAILDRGGDAYPVAYAQAEGDIHLAAGRAEEALVAYRAGRDTSTELGEVSVVLDNKVRSLETRMPIDEAERKGEQG